MKDIDKLIALVEALPQMKLRLPKPSKLELGETGEITWRDKIILFEVQEDVNGKKIWAFKRTKQ